jgi:hypothetical protein
MSLAIRGIVEFQGGQKEIAFVHVGGLGPEPNL